LLIPLLASLHLGISGGWREDQLRFVLKVAVDASADFVVDLLGILRILPRANIALGVGEAGMICMDFFKETTFVLFG